MTPSPQAVELARRLAALPEAGMRERVLAEYLDRTAAPEAAQVLSEVHGIARKEGPPFNVALLTLVGLLSRSLLHYELQARLYTAAKEAGFEALLQLFLSSKSGGTEEERRAEVRRELTLGHRKWMARSSRREVVEPLLRDPEPEVVPILLQNPRIVERDVVLLAARRPAKAEVLWEIFAARKWIARYAVKRSLILNPSTPTELSVRLLGFLNGSDLRLVHSSPTLPAPVREAAGRLRGQEPLHRDA
jgi:hypothetical protein